MNPNKNREAEVKNLRELVDCLQKENQQLKELLEQEGIDYSACMGGTAEALSVRTKEKEIFPLPLRKM